MAHFAEIDNDNIVVRVVVVPDEQEHRGQEFMADDLGLGGTWVQTSYNTRGGVHHGPDGEPDGGTPLRGNYAGIGMIYDESLDAFINIQPYPSWSLDENYIWQPPVATNRSGSAYGPAYVWDEDTTSWVPPPYITQPYPSWTWNADGGRWEPPTPYPGTLGEEPLYEWDEDTASWVEVGT